MTAGFRDKSNKNIDLELSFLQKISREKSSTPLQRFSTFSLAAYLPRHVDTHSHTVCVPTRRTLRLGTPEKSFHETSSRPKLATKFKILYPCQHTTTPQTNIKLFSPDRYQLMNILLKTIFSAWLFGFPRGKSSVEISIGAGENS